MNEESIRKVLIERFGNEGFELKMEEDSTFTLILHYPSLIIKNSVNESHEIVDLYIKLHHYQREKYFSCNLYGVRGTVTDEEYGTGYRHSHLSTMCNQFSSFCLGSSELREMLYTDIIETEEYFDYFLQILESYLKWESIEGVPYIRLNTISGYIKLNETVFDNSYVDNLIEHCKNIKTNLNFAVKNSLEMEEFLVPYAKSGYYTLSNKAGNKYYGNDKDTIPDVMPKVLDFNGKEIYLKIIKPKYEKKFKKVLHPNLTKKVCSRLQREIRTFYIRSNRIKPEVSTGNNNGSVESGQVSV